MILLIPHPGIERNSALGAATIGGIHQRGIRVAMLPGCLVTIQDEHASNPQAMQYPRNGVSQPARAETFVWTIVCSGMLNDVAPILKTGAAPHATRLSMPAGMTSKDIAGERRS